MPRPGGAPGLVRRIAAALFVLASATDACPFSGKKGGGLALPTTHLTPALSLPAADLAARARALLATDMGAQLGYAPGQERLFSVADGKGVAATTTNRRALKAAAAAAAAAPADDASSSDLPGPVAVSPRVSAMHIKLEEVDALLPDSALIAKILSKNATTAKGVLGRLADLEWQTLAAEAVVESVKDGLSGHPAAAKADLAMLGNKTAAAEAVARAVVEKLATPNQWGLLLRAAFHDAGAGPPGLAASTPPSGSLPVGGADGSLRHELHWDSNAGVVGVWPVLALAKKVLDAKFGDSTFSWADVIAIGGSAGVKAAGGPTVWVGYGRADASGPDPRAGPATDPLHAKDFSAPALLDAFADFGVGADATVVLMGAHTMGLAMLTTGSEGALGPPKFTNFFYRVIRVGKASFAVDNALASYAGTAPLVDLFAADQAAFFEAWAREYRAMTWWGQPRK